MLPGKQMVCRGNNGNNNLFEPLSNLGISKLEAFADNKINMTQNLIFVLGWVENNME